jgi:hypothetical protein
VFEQGAWVMMGGFNILKDKMRWLWQRRDAMKTMNFVDKPLPVWGKAPKGKKKGRPGETYRGARRNAPRKIRAITLKRKGLTHD